MTPANDYRPRMRARSSISGSPVICRHPSSLALVADQLERLVPCHRDPERFHADKSELVAELRRMAVEAEHG